MHCACAYYSNQLFAALCGRFLALFMGCLNIFVLNEGRESYSSPHSGPGYGLSVLYISMMSLYAYSFFFFSSNLFFLLACLTIGIPYKVYLEVLIPIIVNNFFFSTFSTTWNGVDDCGLVSVIFFLIHGW